jgi:tetratricopeptide (TPR) repeat protein
VIIVIYTIVIAGFSNGIEIPILLTLVGGFFIFKGKVIPKKILHPVVILIGSGILSSAFSINSQLSFYQAWLSGCGVLLLFIFYSLEKPSLKNILILALALTGLGFMIFSWLDAAHWYQSYRLALPEGSLIPSISFRLNGGNTIAAFYSLIAFLFLGLSFKSKTLTVKLLASIGCFSALILILLSSSRGALLGVLAGAGFLLLILFWNQILILFKLIKHNQKARFIALATIIILIIFIILFIIWFFISAANHPTHGNALQSRNEFWTPAIDAFLSSPILGTGPYTFYSWYIQGGSIPPGHLFLHAHNSYLDLLANMGLLGLGVFSWLLWRFFQLVKLQFSSLRIEKNYFTISLLAGVIAFAVHSFFDGLYLMIFAGFTFIFIMVLIFNDLPSAPIKKYERILLFMLWLGVAGYSWFHYFQIKPITQAISAYQSNNLPAAQTEIKKALEINANNTITNIHAAILYSDSLSNVQLNAIPAMEKAVNLDPYWGLNHANLAALYAYNQDYDLALTEINKALDMAPNSSLFALNKGVILEQLNDYEEARTSYKFVLEMNPEWASNYFWRENEFRNSILTSFVTPDESPIMSFDEAIHQSYGIPMVITAQVEMANGNLENAETLAQLSGLTYFSIPAQRMEVDWLKAELAYQQNDLNTALDISAKLLDQLESPGIFGPGSAGASQYYDGVYRHPVLPVELVPQMTVIHLPGEWETRVYEISRWYAEAQKPEQCDNIYQMLISYVPDYEEHYQVSSPCGDN